jgi:pyruvate kinase
MTPATIVRRAKIVVTLGPATDGRERDLIAAGLDVARLNFSHGTIEEHARRCAAIRAAAADVGRPVAVLQDLQGPKLRIGRLAAGGPVRLVAGQELTITARDVVGDAARVSCPHPALPAALRPGDRLLLDDGRIRLTVRAVEGDDVRTRVDEGGLLAERKGLIAPGVAVAAPVLTAKDHADLRFGLAELAVDYVALSFVRSAADVAQARETIWHLRRDTPLIAKLERGEAIADVEAIMRVADGVMVARGDLGVELGPEKVPAVQKMVIRRANARGIPVITATQMLESMTEQEVPTRAEASDVANAVWDGSDAVMLSGETAIGRHPPLVVRTMDRIVREAEAAALPGRVAPDEEEHRGEEGHREDAAVAACARVLAEGVHAAAIAGLTRSGRTAALLSRERTGAPIYAFSPDDGVCRRLALWWGVTPIHHPLAQGTEREREKEIPIAAMEASLLQRQAVAPGQTMVVVGAYPPREEARPNVVAYRVVRSGT